MIPLSNKPNTVPPGGDYPYGKLIDDTGIGDGTQVNENNFNDLFQFFERLFAQSEISANNLPDNAANGWQLFDAFAKVIAAGLPGNDGGQWIYAGIPICTVLGGGSVDISTINISYNSFKLVGKTLFWQININNFTVTGNVTSIEIPLPPAFYALMPPIPVPAFVNVGHEFAGMYLSQPYMRVILGADRIACRIPGGTFNTGSGNNMDITVVAEIS